MIHRTFIKSIITLCAITVALTHFSCEKTDSNYPENHSLCIPEEYQIVGKKHNEGLEYAFQAIRTYYADQMTKSGGMPKRMSKEELLALGEKSAIAFAEKNFSNVPDGFCQNLIEKMGDAATKSAGQPTSEVYAYIEKIRQALENEPKDENHLIEKLNVINQEAAQNLSQEDAAAVYAGTSTCYNSYIYWKENRMKWIVAINFPEYLSLYSDEDLNLFVGEELITSQALTKSWWDDAWSAIGETWDSIQNAVVDWWNNGGGKEIVLTDAGSAGVGAIEGIVAGGAGAAAGAIAEGCRGSIVAAIYEYGKHITD